MGGRLVIKNFMGGRLVIKVFLGGRLVICRNIKLGYVSTFEKVRWKDANILGNLLSHIANNDLGT
jgi:hypothetical protein